LPRNGNRRAMARLRQTAESLLISLTAADMAQSNSIKILLIDPGYRAAATQAMKAMSRP
jgi:hypothetical protein